MDTGKRKLDDRCRWAGHTVALLAATTQRQQAVAHSTMLLVSRVGTWSKKSERKRTGG